MAEFGFVSFDLYLYEFGWHVMGMNAPSQTCVRRSRLASPALACPSMPRIHVAGPEARCPVLPHRRRARHVALETQEATRLDATAQLLEPVACCTHRGSLLAGHHRGPSVCVAWNRHTSPSFVASQPRPTIGSPADAPSCRHRGRRGWPTHARPTAPYLHRRGLVSQPSAGGRLALAAGPRLSLPAMPCVAEHG